MYATMTVFQTFLGFLAAMPAMARPGSQPDTHRRRRAIESLRLSPHLLHDVGMDEFETPADDPRWLRRPDLER
ncbi:hypothetical protein IC608_07895 [Devosia sp. PTR5]|uniref:DUF1127 domain-containing protein n=1 Tax=Devosia oryzisoli TaxID=2774138 RepID=A0A927FVG6_9HYPH|nr:hypothetical protein [Devosia oryzisoli]MBD8065394.1 hypothetical protein [Devosia oryzisoli]